MQGYTVAVVGATGLVGRTMLKVLEERSFPVRSLKLFASRRSAGTTLEWKGGVYTVEEVTHKCFDGVDIALFSAGGAASREFAPSAARAGCVVIDNSSAWRMHDDVPLVVPEVNAHALERHHGIIANPNCSTIQLVVALKPLHEAFGLKRVVVSTYQSPSGAGQQGIEALQAELQGKHVQSPFSAPIAYNTVFHTIKEQYGFSEEEAKMLNEIRKIMELPLLGIAVTCVRVPTLGGHAESVNIETEKSITPEAVTSVLQSAPGIVVMDEPHRAIYPTPRISNGRDEVFVGRIRRDSSVEHGACLWVVADNIRKGAATNAVQIAETLVSRNWVCGVIGASRKVL
ncbi:MAG: aspartate-semialdehyde dehydrogenase [Bacteroidota bacterium]|nr:aspartate-semialdehyde dehydrogenase [Candidatus Kapabacteria bacterium]MDW8219274.1 aspartate-semialdehyde dehydrogenase [Bacteroidota bacterium]